MTVEIQLTRGYTTLIDDEDADLGSIKWCAVPQGGTVYAIHSEYVHGGGGKRIIHRVHRTVLERMLGRFLLPGEMVDHINRDGLDNRRGNLRLANNQQNQWNKRRTARNTSGYKGVFFAAHQQRWKATIQVNGKMHWLGSFHTPEEAYKAYCEAAVRLCGEFARFE